MTHVQRPGSRATTFALVATIALGVAACATVKAVPKVADLLTTGSSRELRTRLKSAPQSSPGKPALLVLAFDGVDRDLLYEMLKHGELPHLGALLSEEHGAFPHADLDERLIATMPSTTMAAWTTAMTGRTPAEHGVTGNEFFMRESRLLAAPAPVSFEDPKPTVAIYTEAYLDGLKYGPSVYDRLRERDPNILVWDAMHPVHSGADRLFVTRPTILVQAFEHLVESGVNEAQGKRKKAARDAFEKLDNELVGDVVEALDHGTVPDVLTVYLMGTDLYAHVAEEGPDQARRAYLKEVADPALGKLVTKLRARHMLEDRWVLVTSDHGHTPVLHDKEHALSSDGPDDPPALLRKIGLRVRPFKLDVDNNDDFDAVWSGGGATAYIYVADRSTCPGKKARCDWARPPRYVEDVLPIADAFFKNDRDGSLVPEMKGTIDMVLTRRPRPFAERDLPFEVYVGDGKTISIEEYLREHPHPTYVDMKKRMDALAVGLHGERAGDVMLLAHNGDEAAPEKRYYFAGLYRSWHGSPSRKDSDVPLIVAHPKHTSAAIAARVGHILADEPFQQKVADIMVDLREH